MLALPSIIGSWSLTSLQQRLVRNMRYALFLPAEGNLIRRLFGNVLRMSAVVRVAIRASDAYNNFKRGNLAAAARNIFDRLNLTSLKAVWDDRKWIGKV
jgi:hypothetical protein